MRGVALSECPFNRVAQEALWSLHCGRHKQKQFRGDIPAVGEDYPSLSYQK